MRNTPARASLAAILMLFAVAPRLGETGEPCSCDPAAVAAHLRQRIQSYRSSTPGVQLSLTANNAEFVVHHSFPALRYGDCAYVATGDLSGLVDILLRANIEVGYPKGEENYQPEARFGVFFDPDQPDELDLWFSQPLHFPDGEFLMVGQAYDQKEATASRISGAATLADELWKWTRAHAYPTPEKAARCHLT